MVEPMNFRRLDLSGADSHDFAHRMFSRNIRNLPMGHGALSLFLSAEGKVQSIFWAIKIPEGMLLLVPENLAQRTYDLIERYHFAEKFTTTLGASVALQWQPSESKAESADGKLLGSVFEGDWRTTRYRFDLDSTPTSEKSPPDFDMDLEQTPLVFHAGLEDLCDTDKGCYIGQEIVERVLSRRRKP